jgi:Tol biopolymer transport system component/DNA-binding winged helix-turn-helix (wHTH) protein
MSSSFRIGDWLVEPDQTRLVRGEHEVKVDSKAMQVLVHLAQNADDVVHKEHIIEAVWEGAFVTDEVLTNAVWELRRALGDDAKSPRYIQTVPRKGYRLIAPVSRQVIRHRQVVEVPIDKTWQWLATGILVAGIGVAGWLYLPRSEVGGPPPQTVPLTALPGYEWNPALSPDGKQVAFLWSGGQEGASDRFSGGSWHIYVKLIGRGEPLQLTDGPDRDQDPAWSPDGTEIAFLRPVEGGMGIFTIPALGGTVRRVGLTSAPWRLAGGYTPGLAWSPDGRFLATAESRSSEAAETNVGTRIILISTETGDKRVLPPPPSTTKLLNSRWPAFSPDGETLAFIRGGSTSPGQIYLQSVDGGDPRLIHTAEGPVIDCDWIPDGSALVYSGDVMGRTYLWRIPVAGGQASRLPFGENVEAFSIARSGDRLAYDEVTWDNLDIYRIPGPAAKSRGQPVNVINSSRIDFFPVISPDGTQIAFTSDRTGIFNIWVCDADGENCTQLTETGGGAPFWSPDGTKIAFWADAEGPEAYVIDVEGGFPRRLTHENSVFSPMGWSHDGEWIYLLLTDGQLWKIPVEGGEARQLTRNRGGFAQESSDGSFLYFLPVPPVLNNGFWTVPVDGGEEALFLEGEFSQYTWNLWEDNLVYVNPNGENGPSIELLDLETRDVTHLASLGADTEISRGFSVSPDGQWIFFTRVESEQTSDIMLVENFR